MRRSYNPALTPLAGEYTTGVSTPLHYHQELLARIEFEEQEDIHEMALLLAAETMVTVGSLSKTRGKTMVTVGSLSKTDLHAVLSQKFRIS